MANLPESASFDAGVYLIETTDDVVGGVDGISNLQAKSLANRTKWLKEQTDALNLLKGRGVAAFSIANSYLGGDEVIYQNNIWRANTAITAGAWNSAQWTRQLGTGAESNAQTSIADATAGALLKVGAFGIGDVGIIPASINDNTLPSGLYRVPSTDPGSTFGFNSLIIHQKWSETAASQVGFPYGTSRAGFRSFALGAWSGWSEFLHSGSILTPPQFDNDLSLTTSEFVQRALGNKSGARVVSANTTLTAADAGRQIIVSSATASDITITLPDNASLLNGVVFSIINHGAYKVTVVSAGTASIAAGLLGQSASSVNFTGVQTGITIVLYNNAWSVVGGSILQRASADFGASLTGNGYQKLPSGQIKQWGSKTVAIGNNTVTLPLALPTSLFSILVTQQSPYGSGLTVSNIVTASPINLATFNIASNVAGSVYWEVTGI